MSKLVWGERTEQDRRSSSAMRIREPSWIKHLSVTMQLLEGAEKYSLYLANNLVSRVIVCKDAQSGGSLR